ncbi:MAG: GtrA family protein [Micavibrio sp.]
MNSSPALDPVIRQFIIFCGIGLINTGLSLAVILLLSEVAGVHYVLANILGYAAGLGAGFIMHKKITFQEQARNAAYRSNIQMVSFLGVFLTGYLLQLGLLMYLVENIGLPNIPSQIAAWGLYVIISFSGNKFLTFRARKKETP